LLKLAPGVNQNVKRQDVMALHGVAAYVPTESISATIRKAFALYNVLVALTLLSAGVMAMALLYNAMSANVSERTGELSTLQAAGMGAPLLGRLVAVENMTLVAIGVPAGLIAGTWLAEWFMSNYVTQGYRWHLMMHTTTPLLVAAAVLTAALLTAIPVTGPRELVHGERESFIGEYSWQRSGLGVGSPAMSVAGGGCSRVSSRR
jgi:putative ABC transport system permease protein